MEHQPRGWRRIVSASAAGLALIVALSACGVRSNIPDDPDLAEIRVMLDKAATEDARDNVETAAFLYDQAVERAQALTDPVTRTFLTLRTQAVRLAWRDTRGLEADFAGQAAGIIDRALRLQDFRAGCVLERPADSLLYAAFFGDLKEDLARSENFPDYLANDLDVMVRACMSEARLPPADRRSGAKIKSTPIL